ncbi:MAG: cyanoexosortase A [Cyanobacteria bacterium P01_A01_bin.17]
MINPTLGKSYTVPTRGLIIISAALAAIFLHLNVSAETYSHLALSITFVAAAFSTLSDKREQLRLNSDLISILVGIVLLGLLLAKSVGTPGEKFVGFFPLFAFIGVGTLASGLRGLGQYRQELIVFFFLGLPRLALAVIPNLLAPITAAFSTFLLWYTGAQVALVDNNVIRFLDADGGVEVVPSCSGLNLMLYMLGVSVLFLILFPTRKSQKILLPIVAMALGFFVNAIRVALLAILSTYPDDAAFEYWHSQGGALIFVCIAVLLFGSLCLTFLKPSQVDQTPSDS